MNINSEDKIVRVFEAFAGYGGASFALSRSGINHKVIGYSEIDKYAVKIYEENHKGIKNYGDITSIVPEDLPDFDLFTGGFPCQPFSTAGKGLGIQEKRGILFYDIIRIISVKKPKHVLLENVKGLTSKKHKEVLSLIISELESIGYQVFYNVLNTLDYGIPQNRERLWIYATQSKDVSKFPDVEKMERTEKLYNFLDLESSLSMRRDLYLSHEQAEKVIEKTGVDPRVSRKLCLDIYNKKIKIDDTCCTLTEPHHNTIRIIEPMVGEKPIIRKLSEIEHFRLMGFKEGEINFSNLSYTQLCKRAGNGWDINLVSKIFSRIFS